MISNIEIYKKDLDKLISFWENLELSLKSEFFSEEYKKQLAKNLKIKYSELLKKFNKLLNFRNKYQDWYSESLILIKQLLPDRLENFTRQYEKPKNTRKEITIDNYVIEDYLQGIKITRLWEEIVGPSSAISRFQQQLCILKSTKNRFESSLFDIKQLVQADVFDSELESAKELIKKWFIRWGWAIAWVILEKHLSQICPKYHIAIAKKDPSISDYNDKLKDAGAYEIPTRRKIQHLWDLRNLCDHNKKTEPSLQNWKDLVFWVETIIKNIF